MISYVYILECSDGSLYTGVTSNLEKRLKSHESGLNANSYTYLRRPVKLVFYESYNNIIHAISVEKKIKKWSRAKKQALIDGRFKDLIELSKKKFKK